MIKVKVDTVVKSSLNKVIEGFNEKLFLSLAPPFPRTKLIQFDGCKKGDMVIIQLNFIFYKSVWEAVIIDVQLTEKFWYFTDEAIQIPYPFKIWQHQHLITKIDKQTCEISDIINYSTGNRVLDLLMYPFVLSLFRYRKPVYRRYFDNKNSEHNMLN